MRQNIKRKFKPNPSINSRQEIRSSSIRSIIGDRRFKAQFSPANTHGTEGTKGGKRMNVGGSQADDLGNVGRNASSIQCEDKEASRRCCVDVAAKTAEYAFFKRLKENAYSNVHVHLKYLENQLNNVHQGDHLTREISNVQKESSKYARSSLPAEKEQDDARPTFDGPKISGINNAFGSDCTNNQKVKPGECNWLSPSMGSKTKASGNKGVFSAKREKLHQWVADKSLYEDSELCSKGFDLVSMLISRILPENQKNNRHRDPKLYQDETDSKHKRPSLFEPGSATLIKGHESHKRKLFESDHLSYLDDGFSRLTGQLIDIDLLEWAPKCSESSSVCHAPKSNFQYNCNHTEFFRIPSFAIESISYFDKPPPRYGSGNLKELDQFHLHNGRKSIEQPHTLLLGWEDNSENHEFESSALSSHTEIDTFSTLSTSQNDDYQMFLPNTLTSSSPSSPDTCPTYPRYHLDSLVTPYTGRHPGEEHFLGASTLPYIPKHLMLGEDCSIKLPQDYTWCQNKSLIETEHSGSEPSFFLIRSPGNNLLSFLNTGLHSFLLNDENEENRLSSPNDSEGRTKAYCSSTYMDPFHDTHALLLHDSSRHEWQYEETMHVDA